MIEIIAIASSLLAIFSFGTFILSLFTVIEMQAFKKSTHQIEYVPVEQPEMDMDWATSEEAIEEDLKKYKDEMKKDPSMSFFSNDITDKDIRSF